NVRLAADVPHFQIVGEKEKTVLLPGASIPVTLGSLHVSDAHIEGTYALLTGRIVPSEIRLTGKATSVRVGADDTPWNIDAVHMNAQGVYPDYQADVTLNETLPLELHASFDEKTIVAAIDVPAWPREALLRLLPTAYGAYLDTVPSLQNVSAQAKADIRYPAYRATFVLTPDFDDASPFSAPLRAEAKGNFNQPDAFAADITIPVEEGAISAVVSMEPADGAHLEATLAAVDIKKLAPISPWTPLSEALARPLSGDVSATWDGQELSIETALEGPEASWGTELLRPLPASLNAIFHWNPATETIRGDSLVLNSGDDLTVQSRSWRLQLHPLRFEGAIKGKAQLPGISPVASELGLGTEVHFEIPLTLRDNSLALSLDAVSDYFQFGDFSFYEAPFHATAMATIPLEGPGMFRDFSLTYGESSLLTVTEGILSLDPFQVNAPYTFASKLRLLVEAGLLETVEGALNATGKFTWHENLVITSDYYLEAPLLVTGGSTIALGGVSAEAGLRVDQSLSGTGHINVAECALAGFPFKNIATPLNLEGAQIYMNPLAGELFGGLVKGTVDIDVAGESPAVQAAIQLRNIDLEQFAGAMIPPEYGLKGLAQGFVSAQLTTEGLEDATVKLVSSGDFALNKALLQKILLDYLSTMPGAETIERISSRVLGTDEWRPFDSASLDLAWAEDSRMTGNATLRSVDLNLNIDLNIDEPSIRQLLELQQQARLENIETIRSEPVEDKNGVE
ncbi:MAG: hypothetical protein R6V12_13175, partial [Candidatus Hydrogenedentota bacterium]